MLAVTSSSSEVLQLTTNNSNKNNKKQLVRQENATETKLGYEHTALQCLPDIDSVIILITVK